MIGRRFVVLGLGACVAVAGACGRQASQTTSPTAGAADATGAPAVADGALLKVGGAEPVSPDRDQAVGEAPTLTATVATGKVGAISGLLYRFEVYNEAGVKVQDSGLQPGPTFKVTATLDFKKRYTWRARAEAQGEVGSWSRAASFISPEGGYLRGNEVFDPLFNGATVGEVIGPVTFLSGRGVRLETVSSYVRYLIPQTITSGEFSMEVEGLRANAPGDKSKVFGMQQGTGDYIVDPFRVDVQYRGTAGFPPNSITFRALYGSETGLDVRYEPDTGTRMNSVYSLDSNTTYYWKATWGSEFRVTVREGGINGRVIYDIGVPSPRGTYNPVPQYAFIGTPTGRSGAESATIPGTIYRNVWIGARARPQ